MCNRLGILVVGIWVMCFISACSTRITVTDPRTGKEYTVPSRYSNVPGVEELAKLCAEEAGQTIHEVVYVDGYFDKGKGGHCGAACWLEVAGSPYDYMEIEIDDSKLYSSFPRDNGIWKIYKGNIGNPECNLKVKEFIEKRNFPNGMGKDKCLAFKRQEKIESQYFYDFENPEIILDNEYHSKISELRSFVYDTHKKEEVAFQRFFTLYPRSSRLDRAWSMNCRTIGVDTLNVEGTLKRAVMKHSK